MWQTAGIVPFPLVTRATGLYGAHVALYTANDSICLRLTAVDTSRHPSDSVTVLSQRLSGFLTYDYGTPPRDSVRVDIAFTQP